MDKFVIKRKRDTSVQDGESSSVDAKKSNKTKESQAIVCAANSDSDIPACWTREQYLERIRDYEWLLVQEGKIGCKVCKMCSSLGVHKSPGLSLNNDWKECKIVANGETIQLQQKQLRAKIFKHKNSEAHLAAQNIRDKASKQTIEKAVSKQIKSVSQSSCRIFRTVYQICKTSRPFTDLPHLIDLQELNGIDIGRVLHTDHSCADIANHIACSMRQKVVKEIVHKQLKIGIMIDESTSVSKKCALVICVRVHFEKANEATSVFLDLVELNETTAAEVVSTLLKTLSAHGFDDSYLAQNWVSFACDGASNMLGRRTGVASRLVEKFPHLIVWHCSNHRLELAVHDVVHGISAVCHMKSFFDRLYSLYSASPKNANELHNCAASVGIQVKKIGRLLGVRWVASSARAVLAVWHNYPALQKHFEAASNDPNRTQSDKAQYKGLKAGITEVAFVSNMGLMLDALTELEDLSLELQKRSTTLLRAHKQLLQKYRVFQSYLRNSGQYANLASEATHNMLFKGVSLNPSKVVKPIESKAFYDSLLKNLSSRMFTTRASHCQNLALENINDAERYNKLISNLEVLETVNWPTDGDICFGDEKIRNLCEQFMLSPTDAINGFRDYVDSEGKRMPKKLEPLMHAIDSVIVSTSECERAFSGMNLTISDTRNKLSISTASSLLFIRLAGPPLSMFIPDTYVDEWLVKGRRNADEKACQARTKKDSISNGYNELYKLM